MRKESRGEVEATNSKSQGKKAYKDEDDEGRRREKTTERRLQRDDDERRRRRQDHDKDELTI